MIYDPYNKSTEIVDLPGISHPGSDSYTEYHANGIDYDAKTGQVFIAASSASAFTSIISEGPDGTIAVNYSNANYTGPNHVLVFDPQSGHIVTDFDLTAAQDEFHNITGNLTNGFQDMAEIQSSGDSYAIGTFGNSIVRLPSGSKDAQLWYAPSHYNETYGFGGIVAIGGKLIISDTISGGLVTFNTNDTNPKPTYVTLQGLPQTYSPPNADGLYAPKKYNNTVILWSDDYNGTSVYGSIDDWTSAHFLGLINNDDPGIIEGSMTTDSFEIGDRVFALTQIFQYSVPVQPKKNFLFYDISVQLDAIVNASFLRNFTCSG